MNMREAEARLAEAIGSVANPMVEHLGLSFHAEDKRSFAARTPRCRIKVILEWQTVVTWIIPVPGSGNEQMDRIQVGCEWVDTPDEIPGEVQRQLRYLISDYGDWLRE